MTPRAPRLWTALWIALAIGLVLRTGGRDRGVITDHLEFGRRLFASEPLYAPFEDDGPLHSVYPPSFGLMTAPFTLLPERGARYAWGMLQVLALWGIGACLVDWLQRLGPGGQRAQHRDFLLAFTLALAARYVLRDTHGGGGNLINLALALGAFRAAEGRRGNLAALLLGISLATKPTTALLIPVLIMMGHAAPALGSLAVAAGLAAVAVGVHGRGLEAFAWWAEGALAYGSRADLFAPPLHDLPGFTWMNQCLRCAVARYCGTVPAEFVAEVPGFFQGAGWAPTATAWISRSLGLLLLAGTLWLARATRATFGGRAQGIAAALAAGLLLSPISWKAHHVALIPAFFLLVKSALEGSRLARSLAVVYFVLCVVGGGDLVGPAVKEWQQSLYLATFGTVALWAWLATRRTGEDPETE